VAFVIPPKPVRDDAKLFAEPTFRVPACADENGNPFITQTPEPPLPNVVI
jgi:hypothetical protein